MTRRPEKFALISGIRVKLLVLSVFIGIYPWLINPEVVHHHTATHARERARVRDAFARRRGDRETQVAFAAKAKTRCGRAVLDEQRRVESARHRGDVLHIVRVDDGGVLVVMLGLQ